jgi:DNA-binding beta-propeller fold protein YncE
VNRKTSVALFAVVAALLAVTGCGTATPTPPAPRTLPPPAEPAVAPATHQAVPGFLLPVGASPEGVTADGVTHLVAVGVRNPNALVLVNDVTDRQVARVPLPGHLRHLQLAGPGGPVLVPDENSGDLLTVALPAGKITATVPTGSSPHDATAAGNGEVFVANEAGRSVVVVRGNQVVHTFTDVVQPAGLAAVGTLVGLVDVRQNTLHVYDAATLTARTQLPAGAGPTHVVADKRGHLAVIDTRGNAVLFYQLTPTPKQIGRLALPGTPYGVAYDPKRDVLWVTLTARNQLVEISLTGGAPKVLDTLATVRQPNTVAVDPVSGDVFVTGADTGTLQMIHNF